MKKVYKLSIIAMLLLLSLPCRAQISSIIAEATPQFSNDSGIVRYWRDSIFISCNQDLQDNPVFTLIQKGNPVCYQVSSSKEFTKVTDFQILGDEIFFCGEGYYGRNLQSVIGRFDINQMLSGSVTFDIMNFNNINLTKLVAYPEGQRIHIVSIGNVALAGSLEGLLVECYYSTGLYGLRYYHPSTQQQPPIFRDIVSTDNFVGVVADYGELSLFKCPKNNISLGITGYEYRYPTIYQEPFHELDATAMKGDIIATASFAFLPSPNSHGWSNNVRLFDLATMDMVDAQSINLPNKGHGEDIVYIPFNQSLVVSHWDGGDHGGILRTELVTVFPFMTTTYASERLVINTPQWHFHELGVAGDRYLISPFGSRWFVKDMSMSTNRCYTPFIDKIKPIPIVPTNVGRSPYVEGNMLYSTYVATRPIQQEVITIICQ